jgi:hypothetical protein
MPKGRKHSKMSWMKETQDLNTENKKASLKEMNRNDVLFSRSRSGHVCLKWKHNWQLIPKFIWKFQGLRIAMDEFQNLQHYTNQGT